MQIIIDGDACNVIAPTERIAQKYNIPCHIYCDTKHLLESSYSQIHIVETRNDSADFAILNKCGRQDIVITNDSGLAAMVLAKNAYAINSKGFAYDDSNIMLYLNNRHLRKRTIQKTHKLQVKGIVPPDNVPTTYYTALLDSVIQQVERNVVVNA